MNETYVECLISRKNSPLLPVFKFLLYGIGAVCIVLSSMLSVAIASVMAFVLGLVFLGVAYFVLPMMDLEYEYLYLDREISIDKVMGKEKRKHLATINLNAVEKIAVSKSHEMDSYKARPHKDVDYSSRQEGALTYIVPFEKDGELTLYTLEMNEEMVKAIKNVFPRKIVEY